tara:strand:+ start:180 stop:614 length:435 start_codon:yes stop_codon:yes gene_type:complete
MKFLLSFTILLLFGVAHAKNTSITISSNLKLNCKFEKVIIKNPEYNFETFTKDQIKRNDINELTVLSKTPDTLIVKNLSNFINNIDLEVKIFNKDIFLIQAFDKERNYSESAVLTFKTGELVHEITSNLNQEIKIKDISFYACN